MARTSYISMRWWWCLLCTRPTILVGYIYIAISLIQQSTWRQVSPLRHIILINQRQVSPLRYIILINQSLFLLHDAVWKAVNTNCIVFGFIRPVLEPTIYHTRSEHVNHYTAHALPNLWDTSKQQRKTFATSKPWPKTDKHYQWVNKPCKVG